MNNLVKVSHHYRMLLKLPIKLKSTSVGKWGLPFQTREVQQGTPRNLSTNPYMSLCVEAVSSGEFFSHKHIQEELTGTHKSSFIIKTISERNGDHDDLE